MSSGTASLPSTLKQLKLAFGATAKPRKTRRGRKPTRRGTWAKHRPRPFHDRHHPVHVTLRARSGLPTLRGFALAGVIGRALRARVASNRARDRRRVQTFRVVEFSIQPKHLHLLVEASSKAALARGMQGLASSVARQVNRKLGRRGALFSDRYHAPALRGPREVRNGLVYVLKNYEKHLERIPEPGTEPRDGIDPCSSAAWFGGWAQAPPRPETSTPVSPPQTWLLRTGWRQRGGGPVRRDERPAAAR
jgi:putative transposase